MVTIVVNSGRRAAIAAERHPSATDTCVAARFRVAAEWHGLQSDFLCRYLEALVVLSGFGGFVLCCRYGK